jgi:hypothetical protein
MLSDIPVMTDEQSVVRLRETYKAVRAVAEADQPVTDGMGPSLTKTLGDIETAAVSIQAFLMVFRQRQAARFADEIPGYEESK